MLESSTIPLRLRRFQYIDFTSKNYDEGIESARILLNNLGIEYGMEVNTPSLVDQTSDARSSSRRVEEDEGRVKEKPRPVTTSKTTSSFRPSLLMIGIIAGVLLLIWGTTSLLKSKSSSVPESTQPSQPKEIQPSPSNTSLPVQTTEATVISTVSPSETPIPPTATLGIASTVIGNDGMTLYYVPAGDFVMGSNRGDANEQPVHTVYLDAFWIDETEVTNSMYAIFLDDQGNQVDGDAYWLDEGDSDVKLHPTGGSWIVESGYEDHPVVEVSWYGAKSYCSWVGRALPTEAQWEKAARNSDGRDYPWGNDVPGNGVLNFNNYLKDTTPVEKYPRGVSPYRVLDMGGNVWEWVADWYGESYYRNSPSKNPLGPGSGQFRVRRGGSFTDHGYVVRATYRASSDSDFTNLNVGFRCAMNAIP